MQNCGATARPSTCDICGKAPEAPHDNETRGKHLARMARIGRSGMCPSPQRSE
ncbi:hypothetical protein [Streptosporangium longisporum]|uniref:Uncharacterized protein n=1 Tax=Streptosporangium longisporum TaxID=46187 RepID=A0ABP6KZ87_9ACTN